MITICGKVANDAKIDPPIQSPYMESGFGISLSKYLNKNGYNFIFSKMDEIQTIVIDNGSSEMKAGWGGDEAPLSVFRTVVGHSKSDITRIKNDIYIGDEANAKLEMLTLKYPIERGIVVNWDDMENIYNHIFKNELHTDPKEHPILLTEAPLNPKSNREKMIQIMFETFEVPSFYVAYQSLLSAFLLKNYTGVVCDVGDSVTQIFPIYEGYVFKHNIKRLDIGGGDVTNSLQTLLNKRGYTFTTQAEKEIVRDIKENHAYAALDYNSELDKSKSTSEIDVSYKLPTGNTITFSDERFRCTESLFNPCLNGFELSGVAEATFESIKSCNIGARKRLFANIIH